MTAAAQLPLVIAHRGASGYRPEHTLETYRLAIAMGADCIEPDLVTTRDHVLVARHENELSRSTDVAARPEFAERRTTKLVDGRVVTGWFTEDFTLQELKTLRATERFPDLRPGNTIYDGRWQIPTFQEIVELVRRESARHRRRIALFPELKHPSYFASIGLPLDVPVVDALDANGYDRPAAPIFVQSFEVGILRELARATRVRLVQLVDAAGAPHDWVQAGDARTYDDMLTPVGLREISTYATGINVAKSRLIPRSLEGSLLPPTSLVADARFAGLLVYVWTFRSENAFLPPEFRLGSRTATHGDAVAEYDAFFRLGVDGVFSDQPDTAVQARTLTVARRR